MYQISQRCRACTQNGTGFSASREVGNNFINDKEARRLHDQSQLTRIDCSFRLTKSSILRVLFERPLSWLLRRRPESVRAIPSTVEIYGFGIAPVSNLGILCLI